MVLVEEERGEGMKNKRKLDEKRASLNVMISSFWGQGVYIERENISPSTLGRIVVYVFLGFRICLLGMYSKTSARILLNKIKIHSLGLKGMRDQKKKTYTFSKETYMDGKLQLRTSN